MTPISLSDNEVYALCIDGAGSLWIGTRNGLNRYDAQNNRFETFLHDSADENSLAANEIFSLAKDSDGNLWIGAYNGALDKLVKTKTGKGYKKTGYNFLHYRYDKNDSNSISTNQVYAVCFDNAGHGWIGTTDGLNIMDKSGKKISRFYADRNNKSSISNNTINKIVAASDGTVWLLGKNMLDNVSLEKNSQSISVKHVLPLIIGQENKNEFALNDFIIDRNNNYWVATNDNGIFKFKTGKKGDIGPIENLVSNQSNFSLANTSVFTFYEDNAGIIWIGTAKGISKYVPSKARFNEENLLPESFHKDQFVRALLYDDQQRLWIGSDSDTMTVIDDKKSYPLPLHSSDRQFNQVNALYQSRTGDIYVATFTAGLYIIPNNLKNIRDTRQWIHIDKLNSKLSSNNINAIAEDKNGIIWLGTFTGLNSYDPQAKKLNNVYVSPNANIVSAFIIRTLFIDEQNIVWCGTDHGLALVKDNSVLQKFLANDKDSTSLSNNQVTVIYGDDNKNIWVGTKSGLNLFDTSKNNFKHFIPQNEVTVETVMAMRKDKAGNLWLGTNDGLVKFNVATKHIENILLKMDFLQTTSAMVLYVTITVIFIWNI
jgi:ligand-binding sensor domain-containing protein